MRSLLKTSLKACARGKIRFISGSWGSGKTHFLRLLREEAFDAGYLVSSVELRADETPFNRFEEVFSGIIRNITSPEMYRDGDLSHAAPFAEVLRRALFKQMATDDGAVTHERLQEAKEALLTEQGIDIDFRRMVGQYWETFLPESGDRATLEDTRGRGDDRIVPLPLWRPEARGPGKRSPDASVAQPFRQTCRLPRTCDPLR